MIDLTPQAQADALLAAARKLDEMPHTGQEQERLEKQAAEEYRRRQEKWNGQASVIEAFNRAHSIDAMLESHGYTKGYADRYIRPGGKSESVSIRDGRSTHFSSNDPLNDGRSRGGFGVCDPFDVFVRLNHAGDVKAAVKDAAAKLGIKHEKKRKQRAKTIPGEKNDDRATELANAEEVHRQHGAELRYHNDRGEYFVNTGKYWKADVDGQVERWAKEVAKASSSRLSDSVDSRELARFTKAAESARGIGGVIRLLQSEPGVSLTSDRFDRDDYLLNVANGTIELRTGNFRPHDPADLITHCLTTPYDATATCPLWESVIHRSMAGNDALIGYLRRWSGLFLTGSPNTHELLIAHGTGANGKSVIFDTLCGLLESLAGVAPESLLIARHGQSEHPTEIANLLGKRLVVASETESGATLRLQLIKRLTGDTTITARFMRQDFFEFRRTHKLVLITNNKPRLSENTEAVWRRLRLLPFNVVIPPAERDPNLLDKLKQERPGILTWCVRGCLEQQRDGMNPPDEVLVATNDYRAEADELAEFITERCIVGDPEMFRVSRTDLHGAYVGWARSCNDRNAMDRTELYEAIRHREGIVDATWKAAGQTQRGFKGIGLAAPSREETE